MESKNYIKTCINIWLSNHMNLVFDSQKAGYDGMMIGEMRNVETNNITAYGLRHNGNCFVVDVGECIEGSEKWFSNADVDDNDVSNDIYDMLMDMYNNIHFSPDPIDIRLDPGLDEVFQTCLTD